jgi:hypothetical protein
MKDKLYILDHHFSHTKSSSGSDPKNFDWLRSFDGDHIIITDSSLSEVDKFINKKKYAWLIESPAITPYAHSYIKENYNKFDLIFTFYEDLLSLSEKFILLPIGGCWIKEEDMIIHKKIKNLSFILSDKKTTDGQLLRHEIFNLNIIDQKDIYGFNNHIENKISALKEYRFSIIIENTSRNFYFTEKIIDCFATGTVPIYWGCPKINKFFDINGIIQFENINQLKNIINSLNEDLYNSKMDYIKYNYNQSKNYLTAEDQIYNILKNLN